MKKLLSLGITLPLMILVFSMVTVSAQDKKGTVSLTIEEEGETVVDTVFDLKEGQDAEQIRKIVAHLTGSDGLMVFSGDKDDHKLMTIHTKKGDKTWDIKHIDSLMHAHADSSIMVFMEDDGNLIARVLNEDETAEWVSEEGGKHKTVKVIVSGDGDEHDVHVKKHGKMKMIMSNDDSDEDINVYVIESDGKKGTKTIRVEVEVDAEQTGDEEIVIEEEKKVRKKKSKQNKKQKKE